MLCHHDVQQKSADQTTSLPLGVCQRFPTCVIFDVPSRPRSQQRLCPDGQII